MAITPGKLQTQSSAHASVIRPDTAPAKYLPRLLIYAVIALAAFLNKLAQCPGVSLDIEAHSEGVPVSLSALIEATTTTRQSISRVIAIGGPIMGTPMANDST